MYLHFNFSIFNRGTALSINVVTQIFRSYHRNYNFNRQSHWLLKHTSVVVLSCVVRSINSRPFAKKFRGIFNARPLISFYEVSVSIKQSSHNAPRLIIEILFIPNRVRDTYTLSLVFFYIFERNEFPTFGGESGKCDSASPPARVPPSKVDV